MKLSVLSTALTSLLILFTFSLSAQDSRPQLRVASYNILHCCGINNFNNIDPERTAALINSLDTDVCSLQEVDNKTDRCGGVDQTAVLAEKTGRVGTFSAAITIPGGEYGVALLSRQSPRKTETVPLPGQEERRTLLIAEFDDFVLFNTHLSLEHDSRVEAAQVIRQKLREQTKPVILTGDMNVNSDAEREELFGKEWTVLTADQPTFPSDGPLCRIDYIQIADPTGHFPAGSEHWSKMLLNARVVDAPNISDHLPVIVDIDLTMLSSRQ